MASTIDWEMLAHRHRWLEIVQAPHLLPERPLGSRSHGCEKGLLRIQNPKKVGQAPAILDTGNRCGVRICGNQSVNGGVLALARGR